ncbi:hypothetical protein CYMTET_56452 [Cymbomonas tetramitiformis]|uniref:Uncharacterized protein n=1 Tax=Cymbomonas tetramitiformis TaxID=36881 RepID=A0AAE0BAY2_9CHLO|nr:hypothetical protein CYMTET_56452 [Cymbomonas tetramitiformis]
MKYEQMVLGPSLAYFHDAIVYEEAMVDLLQNLPDAEYTPFLEKLWNWMLRGHNTKKGVYGLLCNRYTMLSFDVGGQQRGARWSRCCAGEACVHGAEDLRWHGGDVADTVLMKWLVEFDNSKAKAVMTTTAKQAAGQSDEEIKKPEEEPQQRATATPWKTALLRHGTEKLGGNQHSVATAEMQAAALEKTTADNYERHWKKFVKFCTEENLQWLPATATTVRLYMAALQKSDEMRDWHITHLELEAVYKTATVNSFYPLFEKADVQRTGGREWEAAVVCATTREEHTLPYQIILERHAGVSGTAVDVSECQVRFANRHVVMAVREEKVTWLPVGVTEPKGWVQLLKAPDTMQWKKSDHKEECALINVKKAIVPVETVPEGAEVMRMVAVYKPGTLVGFVYLHVDDYTMFTSSVEWKVKFFRVFGEKWPSKDKGMLVELLGMSIIFRDFGLVRECGINQIGLIQRMLERYGMQECDDPCLTPMEPSCL